MEYFLESGPVKKKRYTIGFLDDNQDNDFHNQILTGISEAAKEFDVDIIRFSYYSSHIAYKFSHQVSMVLDHIQQYQLDGLIFLGWTKAGAMYNYDDFIKRFSSIATLSIGTIYQRIPSVFYTGDEFIRKMVLHLMNEHNFTKIAFVEHHRPDNRKDAYEKTMQEYGIYDPLLYVSDTDLKGMNYEQRNRRAVEILLDERKLKVEAIISLNIIETGYLINELKKRGIKVPGDMAVTSYEDGDSGMYSVPGFSTVYFPWKELGYYSCKNIVQLLREGHLPLTTSLNFTGRIICRESCGCLPHYITSAAAAEQVKPSEHGLSGITKYEISEIVHSLNKSYNASGIQFNKLIDALISACIHQDNDTFLHELDSQLRNIKENHRIEELITVIRNLLNPYFIKEIETLLWVGSLFLQAQVLLNEKAACLHGNKVLEARMTDQSLQIVKQQILYNFNLFSLVESLEKGLPKLNIRNCHIFISNSIFTDTDVEENLFDNSVLIFNYRDGKKEKTSGIAGNLKQQLSEILEQKHEQISLAYLLHVTDEVMGFALFGMGPMDEIVYQQLSTHISTALRGIVLMNRLNITYKKLVDQAQREGMADIAADILHNIGNILNSINVSVHLMEDCAKSSVTDDLIMAGNLLRENMHRLKDFISKDGKGKKLMQFYLKLGHTAERMQDQLQYNLDRLKNKIGAIDEAITAQQNYAGTDMKLEEIHIVPILEDAIKLNQDTFNKYQIQVEKNYLDSFRAHVHRAKLFFIIFNIISNARDAMSDNDIEDRKITIILYEDRTGKYLKIKDSGIGIPTGMLNRIFDYGFTTKQGRYGYGLYSCASYMSDMGGFIMAESDGEGKGASFILRFS